MRGLGRPLAPALGSRLSAQKSSTAQPRPDQTISPGRQRSAQAQKAASTRRRDRATKAEADGNDSIDLLVKVVLSVPTWSSG